MIVKGGERNGLTTRSDDDGDDDDDDDDDDDVGVCGAFWSVYVGCVPGIPGCVVVLRAD